MKRWKGETQESYNIRRKAADEAMKERINTVKVLFGFGHSRGQAVYRKSEWKNGEYVRPERKPPMVKSASAARGKRHKGESPAQFKERRRLVNQGRSLSEAMRGEEHVVR